VAAGVVEEELERVGSRVRLDGLEPAALVLALLNGGGGYVGRLDPFLRKFACDRNCSVLAYEM
jgi:hypothetical protein